MSERIAERLSAPGPKRILTLDGGGTRGVITIAFLRQIEAVLQERLGRDDNFVLSNYFDIIAGTSVGSLIATMLARGWRVREVESRFADWGPKIFRKRTLLSRLYLRPQFNASILSEKIRSVVRYEELQSQRLKTGLCIVAKRADTSSTWPLLNNPAARYWTNGENRKYQLHDLVRASTAAPTFFHPLEVAIHSGDDENARTAYNGQFIDGGVSPHNDPALLMFMMAGLKGYNLGGADMRAGAAGKSWDLSPDKLLIVSVGTGSHTTGVTKKRFPVLEAIDALRGVIGDGQELSLALLQWLGRTSFNWQVDTELGDLAGDTLSRGKLLSYVRYDMPLDEKWLLGKIGNGAGTRVVPGPELIRTLRDLELHEQSSLVAALKDLRELIAPNQMQRLKQLATATASDQVQEHHFPDAFDIIWGAPLPTGINRRPRPSDYFPT